MYTLGLTYLHQAKNAKLIPQECIQYSKVMYYSVFSWKASKSLNLVLKVHHQHTSFLYFYSCYHWLGHRYSTHCPRAQKCLSSLLKCQPNDRKVFWKVKKKFEKNEGSVKEMKEIVKMLTNCRFAWMTGINQNARNFSICTPPTAPVVSLWGHRLPPRIFNSKVCPPTKKVEDHWFRLFCTALFWTAYPGTVYIVLALIKRCKTGNSMMLTRCDQNWKARYWPYASYINYNQPNA